MEIIWFNGSQIIIILKSIEGTLFFRNNIWHGTSIHKEDKWDEACWNESTKSGSCLLSLGHLRSQPSLLSPRWAVKHFWEALGFLGSFRPDNAIYQKDAHCNLPLNALHPEIFSVNLASFLEEFQVGLTLWISHLPTPSSSLFVFYGIFSFPRSPGYLLGKPNGFFILF